MTAFESPPKEMNTNPMSASMGWTRALFGTPSSSQIPSRSSQRSDASIYNGWKGQHPLKSPEPFFQDLEARFDRIDRSPYRRARGPSIFRDPPPIPVAPQAIGVGKLFDENEPLDPIGERLNSKYLPGNAASFLQTLRHRQQPDRHFVVPIAEPAMSSARFQHQIRRSSDSFPSSTSSPPKAKKGRVIRQGVRLHHPDSDPIYGRVPNQKRKKLRFVEDAPARKPSKGLKPVHPEQRDTSSTNNCESSKRQKLTYQQQATSFTKNIVNPSKRRRELLPHQQLGPKRLRYSINFAE